MEELFEKLYYGGKEETFDREEWKAKKQSEKEAVYQMIDETALGVVSTPESFTNYLNVQARMERYSVANALLIYRQFPNAVQLKGYDEWVKDGIYPKRNSEKINILERLYITGYCPKSDDLYSAYQGSIGIFMDIEGPNDLSGRYLTEDAPCSLVFCANLAKALGVKTPIMDSVANLASALRNEDYWVTGRTLEKVGLDGMTKDEMLEFVKEGYKD